VAEVVAVEAITQAAAMITVVKEAAAVTMIKRIVMVAVAGTSYCGYRGLLSFCDSSG